MSRKTLLNAGLQKPVLDESGGFSSAFIRMINEIVNDRRIAAGPSQPLTIDTGEIDPDPRFSFMTVDTEAAAASDNLDTINSGNAGDVIYLRSASASRIVTLRHGVGNIKVSNLGDLALDSEYVTAAIFDGTNWVIPNQSNGNIDGGSAANTYTLSQYLDGGDA
jgi:hypothetical protein